MTNEELNEAIMYLEEERLTVEAILYGENQDKFDNTIMLIDDAKFRLSRKPLTIYDMAIKALEQTRWIPVSERLPEDGRTVLVWYEYFRYGDYNKLFQTYGLSYAYGGHWSDFINGESGWNYLRIIAWMPLPPSYQGE